MYRNNDINEYLPENAEIYIYIAILYIVVLPQPVHPRGIIQRALFIQH
jgi:hypothetical protein